MPGLEEEILHAHQNHPAFAEILAGLRQTFAPSGQLENLLVAQMADLQWSIHRLAAYESSFLSTQLSPKPDPKCDPLTRPLGKIAVADQCRRILGALASREAALHRLYRCALKQLRFAQSLRRPEKP